MRTEIEEFKSTLIHYFDQEYSESVIEKFASFLQLLSKWNKTYNLTAITKPEDMIVLHIADSLSINPYLYGNRIIDVGTGAGLPGIPLAIINSGKEFVLLDSNSKKTRFLTQVKAELRLKNIEIVHGRAEDYKPTHCFNTVLSRAITSLSTMLKKTSHLCCPDGQFLAMKGCYPEQEIKDLNNRYIIDKIVKLKVKQLEAERHAVLLKFKL